MSIVNVGKLLMAEAWASQSLHVPTATNEMEHCVTIRVEAAITASARSAGHIAILATLIMAPSAGETPTSTAKAKAAAASSVAAAAIATRAITTTAAHVDAM